MLLSQVLIALSWSAWLLRPKTQLAQLALFALLVAFASATQDIVIDAYRIESAPERLQAAMAASHMTGYRLAMIMAGAGAWRWPPGSAATAAMTIAAGSFTHLLMGDLMSLGVITTLISHEPDIDLKGQDEQQMAAQGVLLERGWSSRWPGWEPGPAGHLVSLRRLLPPLRLLGPADPRAYRLLSHLGRGDGVMSNSFYVDLQFSKTEGGHHHQRCTASS